MGKFDFATKAPAMMTVGQTFTDTTVRPYRDERGMQNETVTYRCRMTKNNGISFDWEVVEVLAKHNTYREWHATTGGSTLWWAFARYVREGRAVIDLSDTEIAQRKALGAVYAEWIGYDPFVDDPSRTVKEVLDTLEGWAVEAELGAVPITVLPNQTVRGVTYFEAANLDASPNFALHLIMDGKAVLREAKP